MAFGGVLNYLSRSWEYQSPQMCKQGENRDKKTVWQIQAKESRCPLGFLISSSATKCR